MIVRAFRPSPQMFKHVCLSIIALLWSLQFLAQTGPGGVGNSGTIAIWLRSDAGTFSDLGTTATVNGDQVRQWNDQSGNARNAIQNTAANRPLFRTNISNAMPGLRFTGNMFIDGPALGIAATSSYTYLITFRDTTTGLGPISDGNGHFILDRTTATNNLVSLKPVTGSFYGYQKRNDAGGGLGGPLSTTSINTNIKTIEMRRVFNTNYQLIYNGLLETTLTAGDGNTTPPNPRIGRHATTNNGGIRGYLFEFVVYNFALNTAQTILVNNYLGAKYNYALSANDIYIQDNVGNGNYDFEVAGIGRVDGSNLHNDAQGTGIVRILNPSNLGNNEYLIWGHDNGVLDAIEYADVPATVEARMERVWRVNEVNASGTAVNVGNIDMRWDLSSLGSITVTDLRLIIDTDNDGLFNDETPISGASDLGSGIYEFSAVSQITNNVRFTLGTINSSQTPLPIELISFDAKQEGDKSLLLWNTASETNNDFFVVERSRDGNLWNEIAQIEGAGNSTSLRSYQYHDVQPYPGNNYYRLNQCDFDGTCNYSIIKSVSFTLDHSQFTRLYPNPANNLITLVTLDANNKDWTIFDLNGVVQHAPLVSREGDELKLDISDLIPGNYIIVGPREAFTFIKFSGISGTK